MATVFVPCGQPEVISLAGDELQLDAASIHGDTVLLRNRQAGDNYEEAATLHNWRTGESIALDFGGIRVHYDLPFRFSPDGKRIAASGVLLSDDDEEESSAVYIWDAATGERLHIIDAAFKLHDLAWSHDGSMIAAGFEQYGWCDADAGNLSGQFQHRPRRSNRAGLAMTPGGELLLHGEELVCITPATVTENWRLAIPSVYAPVVSPCGNMVVIEYGGILAWHTVDGGFARKFPESYDGGCPPVFSSDGSTLFGGAVQNRIAAFSVHTGMPVWAFHVDYSQFAAIDYCEKSLRLTCVTKRGKLCNWNLEQIEDPTHPPPATESPPLLPPLEIRTRPKGRTTPLRAFDLTTLKPWRDVARKAVRLHPRRAQALLPPDVSKVGGFSFELLGRNGGGVIWPARKKWPRCEYDGHLMVPVLQLLAADFPEMKFAKGRDVFQLFWCPHDHEVDGYYAGPASRVFFWNAAKIGSAMRSQPDTLSEDFAHEDYLPHECLLHPERVWDLDFPDDCTDEQSDELVDALETLATVVPVAYYTNRLCGAYGGWKLGGYPQWIQDPSYPPCEITGEPMELLLTITSGESTTLEDAALFDSDDFQARRMVTDPTGIMLGDAGNYYVFHSSKMATDEIKTEFHCF